MSSLPVAAVVDSALARLPAPTPPGLVLGVLREGSLVQVSGRGRARLGGLTTPDERTIFRIASMTKSFTGAVVLALRDDGHLRLDDPVEQYVPEVRGWTPPAGSPRVSLRHLLTMSAGLPTDDPWGDRRQGQPDLEFRADLERGVTWAWPPGTAFEYSNLGYALLGTVVEHVTGRDFADVVNDVLLEPLGLTDTGFEPATLDVERLATGYVHRDGRWVEEPLAPYGAFAPMGGLFSTVADLTRWVSGFLAAQVPEQPVGGGDHDVHPLTAASRREMQTMHRFAGARAIHPEGAQPTEVIAAGYAVGLLEERSSRFGRTIGHSGGYPGFGSHMRWHPASGWGVVALANQTYAPMGRLATDVLRGLLDRDGPRLTTAPPWPRTLAVVPDVDRLIDGWDEQLATRLFAANLAQDEPLELRRAHLTGLRQEHGPAHPDADLPAESPSPGYRRWWLRTERGRLRVEVLLSPDRPPLLQSLSVTGVLDPGPFLARALDTLIQRWTTRPGQPMFDDPAVASLPWAATVDRDALERSVLGVAGLLVGSRSLGAIGGDGVRQSTVLLCGVQEVEVTVTCDPAGGTLTGVSLLARPQSVS